MKSWTIRIALGTVLGAAAGVLQAGDLNQLQQLGTQAAFRALAEDLGAALAYRSLSPATPLGITGFDVGIDASATRLASSAFGTATGGSVSVLPIARLRVQKGLPLDFDVGVSYTQVPGTNLRLWGGELRYALIAGGVIEPAVALRASFSRLSGVGQLDFNTRALDVSVSKGLVGFTPYAGAGFVWANATPNNVLAFTSENFGMPRIFGGVNVGLGLFALGAELDRTGKATTLSAKVSLRW
jgi:hypothetical protein